MMVRLQKFWQRGILSVLVLVLCACGGGSGGSATAVPAINNLVLNASRVTGVAPLAVSFDTVGSTSTATSLPFHEMKYTWTFGDPAGATWAYGAKAGAASKNAASGPVAAHVFETPGSYTVTVTSYDGTTTMTKSVTIAVTNPDVAFASNTVYISQTSAPTPGVNGVPMGANVLHVPNFSSLSTLATTYKRILMKRGDVWSTAANVSLPTTTNGGIIGAYGTGAKPKIDLTADVMGFYLYNSHDWRLMDLEITSLLSAGVNLHAVRSYAGSMNTLVLRLDISHVQFGIFGDGATGFYVVDCNVHDINDLDNGIGMYHQTVHRLAILGSRFSNIPGNHAVRIQGTDNSVIGHSQFDTPSGHALTVRGMQDAIVGTWTGTWTERVVISDNVIDGSGSLSHLPALYVGPVNLQHAERVRDVIVERNRIVGAASSGIRQGVARHMTIRNNLLKITGYDYAISVEGGTPAGSPRVDSTYIYNNTIYKPSASVSPRFSAVLIANGGLPLQAVGTVVKNNLVYAPDNTQDAGQTFGVTTGTVVSAPNVPSGDYVLANNSSNTQVHTVRPWAAATPLIDSDYTPNGYAVSGSGVVVPVWDDLLLNPLTTVRSVGAIFQ